MLSVAYDILMRAASLFCHQIPDRSPHLWGVQLPLCWRCTGIATGTLVLLFLILKRRYLPNQGLSFMLALLMPLDVFGAWAGLWQGHNNVRFLTGLAWGIFGTTIIVRLFAAGISRVSQSRRRGSVGVTA